jgi:outer membrane receptor protein involved in Fe transport
MGKDAKDSKGVASGTPGVAALTWGDKLLDGLRLTVGCNNLFDQEPPFVAGGNSATNLTAYDPFGRFVYFEVSHKF